MTPTRTIRVRLAGAGVAFGLAAALAGCGGSSSTTTTSSSAVAAASPTSSGQGGGGRFNAAMQTKIRQCLAAAGIAVPTFTRPSNLPSGQRPSFSPGTRPSGGLGGRYADPKTRAALAACGITLPTRTPGASGGAPAPTGSPS